MGYPEPRVREPGFVALLQIILSQQLSTKAALAIERKLQHRCGGTITWRKTLDLGETGLIECGLSRRKIEYVLGLAERIRRGELDLQRIGSLDTEGVLKELITVRGLGRWSGQIYALLALRHPDIFPEDDLGLQRALQRYRDLPNKPSRQQTAAIAERWSPHRSAVALLMWKFYAHARWS